MVDLDPQKLKPTWTNRRYGEDRIVERNDRFLMDESLMGRDLMFKQWMDSRAESDHMPICLKILRNPKKPTNPFKFFVAWLKIRKLSGLFSQIGFCMWQMSEFMPPLTLHKICLASNTY